MSLACCLCSVKALSICDEGGERESVVSQVLNRMRRLSKRCSREGTNRLLVYTCSEREAI